MTDAVRVRVPASSANLGPGFDCLGLALGLYHQVDIAPADTRAGAEPRMELVLTGEGAHELPRDAGNLLVQTLATSLAEHGYAGPDLAVRSHNEIPLTRGLGSSAATYLAGRAAGEWLATGRLDRDRLLQAGRAAEGHADNIAPSIFGGVTVVSLDGARVSWLRLDPPAGLRVLVAVPDFELATSTARAALPDLVARRDAVHGLSRACLLTAAMASGRADVLRLAMSDERLHEPYREAKVPGLRHVCDAALGAGAWGAALSGAGPSVLSLAPSAAAGDVAEAMGVAWRAAGIDCVVMDLAPDLAGLQIVDLESAEKPGATTENEKGKPTSR